MQNLSQLPFVKKFKNIVSRRSPFRRRHLNSFALGPDQISLSNLSTYSNGIEVHVLGVEIFWLTLRFYVRPHSTPVRTKFSKSAADQIKFWTDRVVDLIVSQRTDLPWFVSLDHNLAEFQKWVFPAPLFTDSQ
jgi:hypothetical protein